MFNHLDPFLSETFLGQSLFLISLDEFTRSLRLLLILKELFHQKKRNCLKDIFTTFELEFSMHFETLFQLKPLEKGPLLGAKIKIGPGLSFNFEISKSIPDSAGLNLFRPNKFIFSLKRGNNFC